MQQEWKWAGLNIFHHSWLCECVYGFSNTPKNEWLYFIQHIKMEEEQFAKPWFGPFATCWVADGHQLLHWHAAQSILHYIFSLYHAPFYLWVNILCLSRTFTLIGIIFVFLPKWKTCEMSVMVWSSWIHSFFSLLSYLIFQWTMWFIWYWHMEQSIHVYCEWRCEKCKIKGFIKNKVPWNPFMLMLVSVTMSVFNNDFFSVFF